MSADTPAVDQDTPETEAEDKKPPEQDDRVPYDRFKKANDKAKEAGERAARLEKDFNELKAQLDERESAGLPELERERKAREAAERRLADAEQRAADADKQVQRGARERWVAAAAARENFVDPDDAARYIDLDDVEDADQAERAVKKLAKAKKHLTKDEESGQPQIGRVLEGGKPASKATVGSNIDLEDEAQQMAEGLKKFLRQ